MEAQFNRPLPEYNYPVGTIIEIDGRPHLKPVQHIPGRLTFADCHTSQPFLIPDGMGGTVLPTPVDYDRLIMDARVEVVLPKNVIASRALASRAEWDMSDLEAMDPGIRKVIAQVKVLDENGVKNGDKAIAKGLKDHWTDELKAKYGEPDKPATIKRWRFERGVANGRKPNEMVRLGGKVPRNPHDQDVPLEIRRKHALDREGTKGPMSAAYSLASTELVEVNEGQSTLYPKPDVPYPIFSYATFRRDCIAIRGSDTIAERDGKDMVESAMRGGGRPLTAGRILDKVLIDHTPFSAFLVIDTERDIVAGKAWLTFAIDVHSRAILAWIITFRPPSYWTVCEILRRMNLPKRPPPQDAARYPILTRICGKPSEIIVDNAAEFTSHGLEDAAKSASFSVRFCPIKAPRYRAIGERLNGTMERKMLEHLPGASMTIAYNRRTGHDGEDLACVTINEIEALANKAVAEYHTELHEGIGMPPALKFQTSAARHGIDVMGDTRRFRLETLDVKTNVQVTKSGVEIFSGLRYFSHQGVKRLIDNNLRFEPRRQARVDASITTKIKFDPENIAVIHAWDKTTLSYVELRCQDETYADGMPLWFHEELALVAKAEATASPKATAMPRIKAGKAKETPTLRRLSADEDSPIAGFNTEAERLEARARRIAAVRAIAPGARHRERQTLARLYETPRLRQITGNIVHLDTDYAKTASVDDFISHDVSALTMLDAEILAPRPAVQPRKPRTGSRDRRDAAVPQTRPSQSVDEQSVAPSRRSRARG